MVIKLYGKEMKVNDCSLNTIQIFFGKSNQRGLGISIKIVISVSVHTFDVYHNVLSNVS